MQQLDPSHYAKLLPVIQAFSEGKTIQFWDHDKWVDAENLSFTLPVQNYRIKPPKFEVSEREAKDAVEDYLAYEADLVESMKFVLNRFAKEILKKVKTGEISLDNYDLS